MTIATAWIITAFQSKHLFPSGTPLWKRLGWPYFFMKWRIQGKRQGDMDDGRDDDAPGITIDKGDQVDMKDHSINKNEANVAMLSVK